MSSTILTTTLGLGGEYTLDISDINYLDLSDDANTKATLGLTDTANLIPNEVIHNTSFRGINGPKTIGYQINLEELFIVTVDGSSEYLKYNLIIVDTIYDNSFGKNVPVFTMIEPDFAKSTLPNGDDQKAHIELKNLCTIAAGTSSEVMWNANTTIYHDSMKSSLVNDSDVLFKNLIPVTFIFINALACKLTIPYLFTDTTINKAKEIGYAGLFDSNYYLFSYGLKANDKTLYEILEKIAAPYVIDKPFKTSDDIPLIEPSYNWESDGFISNLPRVFKPIKPSTSMFSKENTSALTTENGFLNLPKALSEINSTSYLFCYMFSAARKDFYAVSQKDSLEANRLIQEHTQTVYPYNGLINFQLIVKLVNGYQEDTYGLSSMFYPYKVKCVSAYIAINTGDTLKTSEELSKCNVVPLAGKKDFYSKYLSLYTIEPDTDGTIKSVTFGTNSYTGDEEAYIVLNLMCV